MEPQGSVFIATSKDGFIADVNGSVKWLDECQPDEEVIKSQDCGLSFEGYISSVDAMVMGRKTYESVLQLVQPVGPHPWPYGDLPVVVLSSNKDLKLSENIPKSVCVSHGSPEEVFSFLQQKHGAKNVYIDGGGTIRSFFDAGKISKVIITKVPVVLGNGIPLFTKDQWKQLKLESNKEYGNGFSQMSYTLEMESKK
mmetsp:Transcript_10277/g.12378  ORF Transcript_10277/g.12378 Transcript_10277/m.12378 type:complete len:197 (+) Transcript_10277:189-779(+)|eukprot:CAMPEP_0184019718 /NCGR_PEP_ID=MMETSP0954-20121128/8920_1 /TAXON_ID=627963 /ORGANISM="Aplanochytrium sp, Strain PBS07" /LENGTH=196 /DNA_ID=CAMNT_0026301441 /DNA_START=144 /DNA_END=734 /DNA_ORIENTATION=-